MDILFKNATVITVCDDEFVVENAFLGIDGDKISYLSKNQPKIKPMREIDATGKVIMPGLFNTHTHVPMSILRGYADDYELQEWLHDHIFKVEAKMDAKCVEVGAKIGMAEMISTGTVSLNDMYFKTGIIAQCAIDAGIMANISNGSMTFTPGYNKDEDNAYTEFCAFLEKYHGHDNGRILADVGVHAEYTSNGELLKFWGDIAREKNLNVHIHVSETEFEHEECKKRHGITPTKWIENSGILDSKVIFAHGVWLEQDDMKIIAKHGGSVAHNPVSNLKLGSGIADTSSMIKHGVNVCLGTDGVASNNTHDLFEEVKLSALLAKGTTLSAKSITAKDAIKMATINGAKAQNRENTGAIKVGNFADIIMLDFTNLAHTPTFDVVSSVAYNTSGRDVCLTMVRGKVLFEDGKHLTIDVEKTLSELNEYVLPRIK